MINRRTFLRIGAASGGLLASGAASFLAACADLGASATRLNSVAAGPLYIPPDVSPQGLILTARVASAEIEPGVTTPIMTYGDGPVGPTIRARSGQAASIELRNELAQPTITHWHGLRPPETADGHPRLAIGTDESYQYDFEVTERAGLYWYHPHPHRATGPQAYFGLAGLFIVDDQEEVSLGLPSDEFELPLVLQDKRVAANGDLRYDVVGPAQMEGFLPEAAFVNGVRFPRAEIESGLYRLRVLNASTSRIFRVGLSNGDQLTLIGTDAGLLDTPAEIPFADIGTGERLDLLVDFSNVRIGETVILKSLPFESPSRGMMPMGRGRGPMGMMGGGIPQGTEMDLLEFAVVRESDRSTTVPSSLSKIGQIPRSAAQRERTFRFDSMMMSHGINGRAFEMTRVDERVPFGSTEIWRFVNDSPFPHPVHMHAVHFQVLSRTGGRDRLFPWEGGWKDTVLLFPGEDVEVIARFDTHRGLFLLHCHNMVHEDAGMMLNFMIE